MTIQLAALSFTLVVAFAFLAFCVYDAIVCLKTNLARKTTLLQQYALKIDNLQKQLTETKPTEPMKTNTINELDSLIADTKGKFFSITFTKLDGTVRTINGKDKYYRLLKGGAPKTSGNVPFVNRNRETWVSAYSDSVVRFKCGSIEKIVG